MVRLLIFLMGMELANLVNWLQSREGPWNWRVLLGPWIWYPRWLKRQEQDPTPPDDGAKEPYLIRRAA
jgi:hypothetical protein